MRLSSLLSRQNFTKFAAGTVVASGLAGWACLSFVEQLNPDATADPNHRDARNAGEMSRDETLVRAMIQNAKESTWRENLSNAVMAQERFVLPSSHPASSARNGGGGGWSAGGRGHGTRNDEKEAFVQKIVERSDRMLEEQKSNKERQRARDEENKTEKFTTWDG